MHFIHNNGSCRHFEDLSVVQNSVLVSGKVRTVEMLTLRGISASACIRVQGSKYKNVMGARLLIAYGEMLRRRCLVNSGC